MGGERGLKWTISTLALIGVWMLLGAGGAAAQDYTRDGWYAGARGLWGVEDFDAKASADDTWGGNVYAGIRLRNTNSSDYQEVDYWECDDVGGGGADVRNHIIPAYMKVSV